MWKHLNLSNGSGIFYYLATIIKSKNPWCLCIFIIFQNTSGVFSRKCNSWIKGNYIPAFIRSCQLSGCRVVTFCDFTRSKWKLGFLYSLARRLEFYPSDGWRGKKLSSLASFLGFSFTLKRTNCKPLCIVSQPQSEGLIYHVIYFWFIFLVWTSFWVWGYKQNNLTVYLWLNKWHK